MKKLIILLPLFLILSSIGQTTSPYGIKSAKIEFAFSNGFQSGTKTLIFTDSGKTEKVFAAIRMDTSMINNMPEGFSTNNISSQILIIQTKDSVFTVDLEKLVGSKRIRFNLDMTSMFNDKKKSIGTDTFLNRLCDVYDLEGFKIWYWKGLVLKKEMAIDGNHKIYEYATSIDEDYPIKSDEFQVPKNVQFK
jgi:hypothetical protein